MLSWPETVFTPVGPYNSLEGWFHLLLRIMCNTLHVALRAHPMTGFIRHKKCSLFPQAWVDSEQVVHPKNVEIVVDPGQENVNIPGSKE